jgi:hypothetical protein
MYNTVHDSASAWHDARRRAFSRKMNGRRHVSFDGRQPEGIVILRLSVWFVQTSLNGAAPQALFRAPLDWAGVIVAVPPLRWKPHAHVRCAGGGHIYARARPTQQQCWFPTARRPGPSPADAHP